MWTGDSPVGRQRPPLTRLNQFAIRTGKFSEKLDRIEKIYADEEDVPAAFTECLKTLRKRLLETRQKFEQDVVPPENF